MFNKQKEHGLKHVLHSVSKDEGECQQGSREGGEALCEEGYQERVGFITFMMQLDCSYLVQRPLTAWD